MQNPGKKIGIVFVIVVVVAVLAFVPLLQLWIAKCMLEENSLRRWMETQERGFYQFVLTGFAVLVALAGYLTYRDRQQARDEARTQLDEYKTKYAEEEKKWKAFQQKQRNWFTDTRKTIEQKLETVQEKVEAIETLKEQASRTVAEKMAEVDSVGAEAVDIITRLKEERAAQIQGVALPVFGESDQDRRARELFNEGVFAYELGRVDIAVNRWMKASEIKPDFAKAYRNLGAAFRKLGNIDVAILNFRKVIEFTPQDAEAHCNLGAVLLQHGDVDDAINALGNAVGLKADYGRAHYNLACCWARKEDAKTAAASLNRAIELNIKYRRTAARDKYFGPIRSAPEIIALLGPAEKK